MGITNEIIEIEPHTGSEVSVKKDHPPQDTNLSPRQRARRALMRPTPVVRINTRFDDKIAQRRHALELKDQKLGGMRIFPRMNPPYSDGVENVDYVVEGSPRYWELTDEENEKSLRRFAAAYGLSFLTVAVFGVLYIANINVLTASLYELLSAVAWLISIVGFTFGPALYGLKGARTMRRGPG